MNDVEYEIRVQLDQGGYFCFAKTHDHGYAKAIAEMLVKTEREVTIWEVEVKKRQIEKYEMD